MAINYTINYTNGLMNCTAVIKSLFLFIEFQPFTLKFLLKNPFFKKKESSSSYEENIVPNNTVFSLNSVNQTEIKQSDDEIVENSEELQDSDIENNESEEKKKK